jgi:minor histocompatibility antigen H13
VCATAYTLGLVTTITVMHVFKAAQPALLYLVPFCTGSALLLAVVRGEFRDLFAYSEDDAEEDQVDQVAEQQQEMPENEQPHSGEDQPSMGVTECSAPSAKKSSATARRRRSVRLAERD